MSKISKLVLISLTFLCIAAFSNNRKVKNLTVHVNNNGYNIESSNRTSKHSAVHVNNNGHNVKCELEHLTNSEPESARIGLESVAANFEEMCIAIEKSVKRKQATKGIANTSRGDQERITVNGISFPASAKVVHSKSGKSIVMRKGGKRIMISQRGRKIEIFKGGKTVVTKLKDDNALKVYTKKIVE